jgi:hypothetical protein
MTVTLKSPYPYFGGKARVADLVWSRFGDIRNYVEPFFGSGAMLLARPHWPFIDTRIETVNDYDAMIPNLWRAIAKDPEAVVHHADWPVSEIDLHARHTWLVYTGKGIVEKCREDPEFYDAKIAGWWLWGICQWIGSGWCATPWQQRPQLGDAGRGIQCLSQKLPHIAGSGRGINRTSQKLPHLKDAGMGVHRVGTSDLFGYMQQLSERMRNVRVCCGDWSRVCGPSVTAHVGETGVFLDPPYSQSERDTVYAEDHDVAADVRKWCLENGDNPDMKIALCGYAGEGHEALEAVGWEVVAWKTSGGYGSQGRNRGRDNAKRERIWFSPACRRERGLFDDIE